MAFEIYDFSHDKKHKVAAITISNNYLVLNKVAREKLNCERLELAFDRDSDTIRIRPSDDGEVVRKTKIYAKGFFKQFGIKKKGKFKAKLDQGNSTLYVSLNENLQ